MLLVFEGNGEFGWEVETPIEEEEKFESTPIKKLDLVRIVKNTTHMILAGKEGFIGCYYVKGSMDSISYIGSSW